jgi:hypothetical protein
VGRGVQFFDSAGSRPRVAAPGRPGSSRTETAGPGRMQRAIAVDPACSADGELPPGMDRYAARGVSLVWDHPVGTALLGCACRTRQALVLQPMALQSGQIGAKNRAGVVGEEADRRSQDLLQNHRAINQLVVVPR